MGIPPFIRRVVLKNFKSIETCDVRLGPLTYLVGPNGSGKSNFVDALRMVADALDRPLEAALRERGGINDVRRRSTGHPHNVGIRVEFQLSDGKIGYYAFELTASSRGSFSVKREECSLGAPPLEGVEFVVQNGLVERFSAPAAPPAATRDRLFLVNASGTADFRALYDALTHMGFYSLDPRVIRSVQIPDPGEILARDGHNLASVMGRLEIEAPDTKQRIEEFLERVVPGLRGVDRRAIADKEALEFRQSVKGAAHPWRFYASSMSDGTLRALGILVALFQSMPPQRRETSLVAIEEPELALHPGAAGILLDSLRDASEFSQVILTTHSPDLLDNADVATDQLLAVEALDGVSHIGELDTTSRAALREQLYTAGELLRMSKLRPQAVVDEREPAQLELFGPCPQ